MKEKGIDLVITVAEVGAIANLARAFERRRLLPEGALLRRPGLRPEVPPAGRAAAEGTKIGLIFAIPEETGGSRDRRVRRLVQADRAGSRPRLLRHPGLGGRRHVRRRAAGRRPRPDAGEDRSPRCGRSPSYTGDGHRGADQPGPRRAADVLPRRRGQGRQVGEAPSRPRASSADRARRRASVATARCSSTSVVGSAPRVLLLLRGRTTAPAPCRASSQFTLIGISGGCVFAIAAGRAGPHLHDHRRLQLRPRRRRHGRRVPLLPAAHARSACPRRSRSSSCSGSCSLP